MPSLHRVRLWGARHRSLVIAATLVMVGLVLVSPFAVWLRASNAQPTSNPSYYQREHGTISRFQNANKASGNSVSANVKRGAAEANGVSASGLGPLNADDQAMTPDEFAYGERAAPTGVISPTWLINGEQQANSMPSGSGSSWQELGPDTLTNGNFFPEPVSGRLLAIAVDPQDSNTIYIGAAQGGIWKTTDGGHTWRPLTDLLPSLAINAITIDSKNPSIIFAGTGEDNISCDSYQGLGMLESTDAGNTWTVNDNGGQFDGTGIGNILLDPRFEGNASTEHLIIGTGFSGRSNSSTESCDGSRSAGQNPPMGVFTSDNGGSTWTQTLSAGFLAQFPGEIGTSDMAMSSTNPNVIYAAEQVNGIYESTDAGHTWTNLDANSKSGLPAPQSGFDRIQLAISQSDPSVLYSMFSNVVFLGTHSQAFRTENGGQTWKFLRNAPDTCDGQCWYDMPVSVNPTNPNQVYFGGQANYAYVFTLLGSPTGPADCTTIAALSDLPADCDATLTTSKDGGNTWQDISLGAVNSAGFPTGNTLHPDDHAITFDPNHPNVMYTGGDGGLFVTSDNGHSWKDLNPGLGTLQFQSVAVSPNGEIFGGTQDNGTEEFMPKTSTTWNNIDGGDGGLVQVDPSNPSTIYHTYAGVSLERLDNVDSPTGPTFTEIDFPFLADSGSFYPAFSLAPSKSSTLYFGSYRVWRSDDKGGTGAASDWAAISPDLTGTNAAKNGCGFACISSVAVSPVNPNVVVVGTGGGLLWESTNADSSSPTWTQINSASMPTRFVTQVIFAPGSKTTIYVTYSGFNENDPGHGGHLFQSTNIGRATPSFTEIDGQNTSSSSSLPDLPTNSVLVTPGNVLFAGADQGVYMSSDGGAHWARVTSGLPHVEVYMLAYDATTKAVVASTHGRGMWSLALGS